MDLYETIDLQTGDHTWTIHMAAKEILLISELGRQLPRELTDSQKLSDKFTILSLVALGIEQLEARRQAHEEWPL